MLCVGKIKVEQWNGKDLKKLVCEFVMPMPQNPPQPAGSPPPQAAVGNLSDYEELLSDGNPF